VTPGEVSYRLLRARLALRLWAARLLSDDIRDVADAMAEIVFADEHRRQERERFSGIRIESGPQPSPPDPPENT
jgi:hypothetical protein